MRTNNEIIKIDVSENDAKMYNLCNKCIVYFNNNKKAVLVFSNSKDISSDIQDTSSVIIKFLVNEKFSNSDCEDYFQDEDKIKFYEQVLTRDELQSRINDLIIKRAEQLEKILEKQDFNEIQMRYIKARKNIGNIEEYSEIEEQEYLEYIELRKYIDRFYQYSEYDDCD